MERNTDRGIWSVVILLIAIGMGAGLTVLFPKVSGYIQGVVKEFKSSAEKELADAGYIIDSGVGRNYLLNSGERVDFEEQGIIPTTVGEYLPTVGGRNYAYGLKFGNLNYNTGVEGPSQFNKITPLIKVIPNEKYVLSATGYEVGEVVEVRYVFRNSSTGIYTPGGAFNNYARQITIPDDCDEIKIAYGRAYGHTNVVDLDKVKLKLEKGDIATNWTPAPEDFNNLKGKSYALSQPLQKENVLSLNGSFEEDDFIGLWLGDDKFVGFLDNQELAFNLTENYDDEFVVVKTLSEKGIVDNAKLEKSNTPTDVSGWDVGEVTESRSFKGPKMSSEMVPTKFR